MCARIPASEKGGGGCEVSLPPLAMIGGPRPPRHPPLLAPEDEVYPLVQLEGHVAAPKLPYLLDGAEQPVRHVISSVLQPQHELRLVSLLHLSQAGGVESSDRLHTQTSPHTF